MVILYLLPLLLAKFLVVYAQLDVQCGSPSGKPAVITYTGDAKAVIAFSVGGKKCQFVEDTATASFKLTIGYKKSPGIDCLLEHTSPKRPSYGTIVETRMLHPLVEGGDDKKYVIECVFTPIKKDVSVKVNLEPKYNPPIFVLKSSGITSKSLFSLTLTNMVNVKFTTPVAESQIVKIRSTMTPRNNEKGYQPLECTAMSADQKVKLLILSDGCGTGFPFKPTQGFQVKGVHGDSPNFRMFRIKKNQGVIFKCTFVICPTKCDENSCHLHSSVGRRKRDIHIRKRRSLGVKYNGLGLISHDESKGIDTAGIHHDLLDETEGTVTIHKQNDKNLVFSDELDSDGFNVREKLEDSPDAMKADDAKAEPSNKNGIQSDQGFASEDELKQDFADELVLKDDIPGAWEAKEHHFDQPMNKQSDGAFSQSESKTMADQDSKSTIQQSDEMAFPEPESEPKEIADQDSEKLSSKQSDMALAELDTDSKAEPDSEVKTMADQDSGKLWSKQSDEMALSEPESEFKNVDQNSENQSDEMVLEADSASKTMADQNSESQSDEMASPEPDGQSKIMADQDSESDSESKTIADQDSELLSKQFDEMALSEPDSELKAESDGELKTMADQDSGKLWNQQSDELVLEADSESKTIADQDFENPDVALSEEDSESKLMAGQDSEKLVNKQSDEMALKAESESKNVDPASELLGQQSDQMVLEADGASKTMADQDSEKQSDEMALELDSESKTMADQNSELINKQSDSESKTIDAALSEADTESKTMANSDKKLRKEPSTGDAENVEFTDSEDIKNAPVWNEPKETQSADTKGDIPLLNDDTDEFKDAEGQELPYTEEQNSELTKVTSQVYKETGTDSNELNIEGTSNSEESMEPEIASNEEPPREDNSNIEVAELPLFPESDLVRKKRGAFRNKGFILKEVKSENFADGSSDEIPTEFEVEQESGDTNSPDNESDVDDTDSSDDQDDNESEAVESSSESGEDELQQDDLSKDGAFSDSGYDASTGDFVTLDDGTDESEVSDDEGSSLQQDFPENTEQDGENVEEDSDGEETDNQVESDNESNTSQEDKESAIPTFHEIDNEWPPESLQYTREDTSADKPSKVEADEATLDNDQPETLADAALPLEFDDSAAVELEKADSASLFEDAATGESTS